MITFVSNPTVSPDDSEAVSLPSKAFVCARYGQAGARNNNYSIDAIILSQRCAGAINRGKVGEGQCDSGRCGK
jgi:hypothetical protein